MSKHMVYQAQQEGECVSLGSESLFNKGKMQGSDVK